jgi:hypothetical protein
MVNALNLLLPEFCKNWNITATTLLYFQRGKTSTLPIKVFLLDNTDVNSALAYHSVPRDVPYGKCFAKTIIDHGGVMLYSPNNKTNTVAQALCHEVFELLIDANCNSWWDVGDSHTLYARDVCGPVVNNCVTVSVPITAPSQVYNPKTRVITTTPPAMQTVGLSDWILPAWTDSHNTTGPFNHVCTLTRPFTIDKGGYAVVILNGISGQKRSIRFSDTVTQEQRERFSINKRLIKKTT